MPQLTQVDVFDYIVFGATGDLTMRKLLPALYYRYRDGQIPDDARIIGTARSALSDELYRARAAEALAKFVREEDRDPAMIARFLDLVFYVTLDGSDSGGNWDALSTLLAKKPDDRIRVYYLATAPNLFGGICKNLGDHGLVTATSRVVLEKPIGTDLKTADAINNSVGQYFTEDQIFRIDHYLGKETVQNLIALRFANPMFERLWSADAIDYVQITAAETVGVEGRGPYYDTSGALRDMIQNHLLQVLTLVAMEPPGSLDANSLRNEKLKVLNALRPISEEDVEKVAVRGQYVGGEHDGRPVDGYLDDLGVGKTSSTETFVAIKVEIQNWRWGKVPFYLRSGKRMARKVSEIVIQFKEPPWSIFGERVRANRLIIRIQPDEGVTLSVATKDPSAPDRISLREAEIDIAFGTAFHTRYPDAYERLLLDAVRGDPTLFIRRDEVEAAWRWVAPVLAAWEADKAPLESYPAGSWGPKSAHDLLAAEGHAWHEEQD